MADISEPTPQESPGLSAMWGRVFDRAERIQRGDRVPPVDPPGDEMWGVGGAGPGMPADEYRRLTARLELDHGDVQALLALTGWRGHPPTGPLRELYDRMVAFSTQQATEGGSDAAR